MKKGFTIAELLIALAIIAVIAAITAPMIEGLMPDKNKAAVLRTFKSITEINRELLNDPGIYASDGTCTGLDCSQNPSDPKYNNGRTSGCQKYPMLLRQKLDGVLLQDFQPRTFQSQIELSDGSTLTITPQNIFGVWVSPNTNYELVLDLNGNAAPNCSYDSNNCKKPDQHRFRVLNSGTVIGDDSLTIAYLNNMYKLNDKKADYAAAAAASNSASSNY